MNDECRSEYTLTQYPEVRFNFDATANFSQRTRWTFRDCIKKGVCYFRPPLLLTLPFYFAIVYRLLFDLTLSFSRIVCIAKWRRRLFCFIRATEQRENSFTFFPLKSDAPSVDATNAGWALRNLSCRVINVLFPRRAAPAPWRSRKNAKV